MGSGYGSFAGATNARSSSGFLAKFNREGILSWVQPCGENATAVCLDDNGALYVSGLGGGSNHFAQTSFRSTNSIFLARFDPLSGSNVWVRSGGKGGYSDTTPPVVAVGPGGRIYLGGFVLGPSTFASTNFTASTNQYTAFIAQYTSEGDFSWLRLIGNRYGPGDVGGICVDKAGHVYATGYNATGYPETAYLTKYAPSGDQLSLTYFPSAYNMANFGSGVCADALGNVYSSGNQRLPAFGISEHVWIRKFPVGTTTNRFFPTEETPKITRGYDLTLGPGGNLILVGEFDGSPTFGPNNRLDNSNTNIFATDGFIAVLNPDNTYLWADQLSGAGRERIQASAVGPDGSIHLTGFFEQTARFQSTVIKGPQFLRSWFLLRLAGAPRQAVPQRTEVLLHPANTELDSQVIGTASLGYQWYRNGEKLPGETNRVLSLQSGLFGATAGHFSVVATNLAGITSNTVANLGNLELTVSNGTAKFQLAGPPGARFQLHYSDRLTNAPVWQALTNLTLGVEKMAIEDQNSLAPARYYQITMKP